MLFYVMLIKFWVGVLCYIEKWIIILIIIIIVNIILVIYKICWIEIFGVFFDSGEMFFFSIIFKWLKKEFFCLVVFGLFFLVVLYIVIVFMFVFCKKFFSFLFVFKNFCNVVFFK